MGYIQFHAHHEPDSHLQLVQVCDGKVSASYLTDPSGNTDWYRHIGEGGLSYSGVPGDYDGDGVTNL